MLEKWENEHVRLIFCVTYEEKKRRLKGKRGQGRAGRRQPGANFHSYHHLYLLRVSNGFTLRGETPGAMVATRPTTQKWRKEEKTLHVFFRMCPRAISRRFFHSLLFFAIFRPCFPAAAVFSRVPLIFSEKLPLPSFLLFPFLQQENGFHDRSNFDPRNHSPPSSSFSPRRWKCDLLLPLSLLFFHATSKAEIFFKKAKSYHKADMGNAKAAAAAQKTIRNFKKGEIGLLFLLRFCLRTHPGFPVFI